MLESNEEKLHIKIESSKKKDRIIKQYSRDRLKYKEKTKVTKEATQVLEDKIQNAVIENNDFQQQLNEETKIKNKFEE